MTRQDFVLIADTISELRRIYSGTPNAEEIIDSLTLAFANRLPDTNPNFNRGRFLKACE